MLLMLECGLGLGHGLVLGFKIIVRLGIMILFRQYDYVNILNCELVSVHLATNVFHLFDFSASA